MRSIVMFLIALVLTGCTTTQERLTANNHIAMEPQIYNQMVLDNLANLMENPATLPYFATLDTGVPQVADMGSFGGFFTFTPQTLVKQLHNQHGGQVGPISGSRSIQSNWTMKPINDDNRLKAMRCLYLWVLGKPMVDPAECDKILSKYYPKNECGEYTFTLRMVPQGWIQCGRWYNLPKGVQYFSHHHGTYYWVVPGREQELTKLNLEILHIALEQGRTKSVVRYYYDEVGKLVQQETTTESTEKILPVKRRSAAQLKVLGWKKQIVRRLLKENESLAHELFPFADQAYIHEVTSGQRLSSAANRLLECKIENSDFMRSFMDKISGTPAHEDLNILQTSFDGSDVLLIPWEESKIPSTGSRLVILGVDNKDALHYRIFNSKGVPVLEKHEELLNSNTGTSMILKQQVKNLTTPRLFSAPRIIADAEKKRLIDDVTSIFIQSHLETLKFVEKVPRNKNNKGTTKEYDMELDEDYDDDDDDDDNLLNSSPSPDLKIDTMSNPEISPGLITLPH